MIKAIKTFATTATIACALGVAAPTIAHSEVSDDRAGSRALDGAASFSAYFKRGRFSPPRPSPRRSTCAGIRGNGANLFAHYGVLARQVEEYGPVTCAAGGSSGSITAFVLESIWVNPDVHLCGPLRPCGPRARDARMALLLKSFVGLSEAGIFEDLETVDALLQRIDDDGVMEMMEGPTPVEGVIALIGILRDLGPLINQEAIDLLLTSPDPVFHATDIIDGLQKGVQFIVDDPRVFLRTSVIDFEEAAEFIGLYGSFYASYGPADRRAFRAWLDACARASRGLTWSETATLRGAGGATCGQNLIDLFNGYRDRVALVGGSTRMDDRVGEFLPIFGVTGVITGRSIAIWEEARAAWIAAAPIPFEPDFADIGVGYWGNERELTRIERRLDRRFADLNSMQFTPLGETTWREVLASSPAEPGFSPAVPLDAGVLSVGGWADPLRILPLDALGARETIAVNRRDGVGGFTLDVTRLLNATDADIAALYSTEDAQSSFSIGLETATGVWCTDWDGQMSVPNLLVDDAYASPLITENARLLRPRFGYDNVGPNFEIPGCNPAP
ncbi:MAG: hypothetical protein AAGJ87_04200 [Pseudomonadota bacterium]